MKNSDFVKYCEDDVKVTQELYKTVLKMEKKKRCYKMIGEIIGSFLVALVVLTLALAVTNIASVLAVVFNYIFNDPQLCIGVLLIVTVIIFRWNINKEDLKNGN